MAGEKILVVDDVGTLAKETVRSLNHLAAMNAVLYPITGVTLGEIIDNTIPRRFRGNQRPAVKCALPGCENMTIHRGGYCCAAHCAGHKIKDRLIANEADCKGEG